MNASTVERAGRAVGAGTRRAMAPRRSGETAERKRACAMTHKSSRPGPKNGHPSQELDKFKRTTKAARTTNFQGDVWQTNDASGAAS
jgi:hypothetical protein